MIEADPTALFVYGTLRDDPRHEMYRVLARRSKFEGGGYVGGRLYDLGEYPGIILSNDPHERVRGEVYTLSGSDIVETLRLLDDYEGIGPDDPAPHEYSRVPVDVTLLDGRLLRAWTYVLTESNQAHYQIPTGDYLEWKRVSERRNP